MFVLFLILNALYSSLSLAEDPESLTAIAFSNSGKDCKDNAREGLSDSVYATSGQLQLLMLTQHLSLDCCQESLGFHLFHNQKVQFLQHLQQLHRMHIRNRLTVPRIDHHEVAIVYKWYHVLVHDLSSFVGPRPLLHRSSTDDITFTNGTCRGIFSKGTVFKSSKQLSKFMGAEGT
jgi:hypothetical protein